MQRTKLKVLKIVLSIIFLLCICGLVACGNPTDPNYGGYTLTPNGSFYFTLNEDNQSFTLEEFVGEETEVVVPRTYLNLPITDIGVKAFQGKSEITSIILPDTILRVKVGAFEGCSSLQYNEYYGGRYLGNKNNEHLVFVGAGNVVYLHEDTKVLREGSLSSSMQFGFNRYENGVYVGSEKNPYFMLIKIDDKNKNSITIHDDTKFVYMVNTDYGKLDSVFVSSVKKWCDLIFARDRSLKYWYENPQVNINLIGNNVNLYADGKLVVDLNVPAGVKRINDYAFSGYTKLHSVNLPNGLEFIGEYSFSQCYNLCRFSIPDSVKGCGVNAFNGCSSYAEYNELDGNKYLGNDTNKYLLLVEANGDTNVTVKENTNYIDFNNFSSSVKSVTLEQNNKYYSIVDGVLYNKAQTKILFIPKHIEGTINIPKYAHEIDLLLKGKYPNLQAINVSEESVNYSSKNGILYNKNQTERLLVPSNFSGAVS